MSARNSPPRPPSAALRRRLIAAAKRVRANAYAPYSRYHVGAAVLAGSGRIYAGVNIETPTLIAHTCAERNAIFSAITRGEREILAVATVSDDSEPCGSCRQVIREFSPGDTPIFAVHHDLKRRTERVVHTSISRLLPMSHTGKKFGFEALTGEDRRPDSPAEPRTR